MSGLRFKLGDLAVFAVARTVRGIPYVGLECIVILAGEAPDDEGGLQDYWVRYEDTTEASVADWQLRKINPPAEPASLTRESAEELTA